MRKEMHATQTNGSESGTEIKPTLHRRQVKQYISCVMIKNPYTAGDSMT